MPEEEKEEGEKWIKGRKGKTKGESRGGGGGREEIGKTKLHERGRIREAGRRSGKGKGVRKTIE